jgi:hypothetical protein
MHHSVFRKPEIHNHGYDQDRRTKQSDKDNANDWNRHTLADIAKIAKIGISGVAVTSCGAQVPFQFLVDALLNPIR